MPPQDNAEAVPANQDKGPLPGTVWLTHLLFVVLAAGLLASVVVNVKLSRATGESPEPVRPVRMDLASEEQFGPENAALVRRQPLGVRIVFAGDSDVALWDPLPPAAGAEIIRRGFGGDRSGDLLVRLERDAIELKPAVVVLTVGGNDLEDIPLFPDQEGAIVALCQRNIRVIVERLRQKGIQVVLLTIFPYGDPGPHPPPTWSNEVRLAVDRVNGMVRGLAGPGVFVFDADRVLTGPDGWRAPVFSADSEHLNSTGYQALDSALAPVLESLVLQARKSARIRPPSRAAAHVRGLDSRGAQPSLNVLASCAPAGVMVRDTPRAPNSRAITGQPGAPRPLS